MNLHTQTLPQVRHLLKQGGWFSPALILSVLSLEFFGRQSMNDFYDTVGTAAPRALGRDCCRPPSGRPARLGQVSGPAGVEVYPLRRPLQNRIRPRLARHAADSTPASLDCAFNDRPARGMGGVGDGPLELSCPTRFRRSYAIQGSYIFYLVGMLAYGDCYLPASTAGFYFPFMLFNHLFPRTAAGPTEPKMSRGQSLFLLGYGSLVVFASWLSLSRANGCRYGLCQPFAAGYSLWRRCSRCGRAGRKSNSSGGQKEAGTSVR